MEARSKRSVRKSLINPRDKRRLIVACAAILTILVAGCGKPNDKASQSAYHQDNKNIPPRPTEAQRLAADRYLYKSEQLRIANARIAMTLKNALSARHYAVIDKIMAKLDHESQVDPRYESLYVAILTSVTTCKKLSGAIQRSLLDYESSEPKSPWAHLLLGRYYDASACHARGEGWAKDVKKSQWKAMYNFDRQAVAEYLDALRINDRLFPAYDGLMRILMDIGNLHEITSIYKRSRKFLPKSDILAEIYMNALKPRWHGNYRLMRQFANSMQQHLDQNPRFYNLRGAVDADKANLAYLNHQDGYALTEYTIALLYGDNPDWLKTAGYAAADTGMYRIASTYLGRYLFYKPQDLNIKKLLGKLKHDCASQPTTASCQEKLPSFVKEETLSELRGSH